MADDVAYYESCSKELLRAISDPSSVSAVVSLASVLAPFRVERVLDVGCGVGQALFVLAVRRNAAGVGVDISTVGLQMAVTSTLGTFRRPGFLSPRRERSRCPFQRRASTSSTADSPCLT
jgi:SAM-dependent methyltransferase